MEIKNIDREALQALHFAKKRLTRQQYKTLRGQICAGDAKGALLGLRRLLNREG